MKELIYIAGFPGSGKTPAGRIVADVLGWSFVDVDQEIVRRDGRTVVRIFEEDGEQGFRKMERQVVSDFSQRERTVVSLGGGSIAFPEILAVMDRTGFIVTLDARPDVLFQRMQEQRKQIGEEAVRPLLEGPDPLSNLIQHKERRQSAYAMAHWTVHTDNLPVHEVAEEVVRAWRKMSARASSTGNPFVGSPDLAATVETTSGSCPLLVGWGLLPRLGELLQLAGVQDPVYIISDTTVSGLYGDQVQQACREVGIVAHLLSFPAGEQSKSLATATTLYQWLAELKAQRGHTVVALGGGVVGDLAGFVAATYNRGMGFVQVPTSLVAMVDASIGGKTAVDLPQAKNLVGAFYQPRMVVADVSILKTLSQRATAEGWAEAIKHGLILDAGLFATFEQQADRLLALEPELTTDVIRKSMAIKARVVSQDERETAGYRILLNYGHTIGHGLEAATEYGHFLHGEAVAVGMMGAAGIGRRMEITPADVVERQEAVLKRFGLPVAATGVDFGRVLTAMSLDKKAQGDSLRWVLLEAVGRASVHMDVPQELVHEVLASLLG